MSFLKKLFGLGGSEPKAEATPAMEEHKGFRIVATPMAVGREYQVAGTITREVDGVVREHKFIRVDRLPSKEEAVSFIFMKGRQIVDQMGDRMFN
jgi:hypothetical protein